VFVGGSPSIAVALVFLAVHLVLAVLVLARPVERALDRLVTRLALE
jgi:small-conductance mechanosensitive channel